MQDSVATINKTKGKLPSLPILFLKNDILGKKYHLSIAFVGEKLIKEVNKKYRGKNKPTNILSFPLSKEMGEILICPSIIKRELKDETKTNGRNFKKYFGFLIIHGMLHLKGMLHGLKMEKLEKKYEKKYFPHNNPA